MFESNYILIGRLKCNKNIKRNSLIIKQLKTAEVDLMNLIAKTICVNMQWKQLT